MFYSKQKRYHGTAPRRRGLVPEVGVEPTRPCGHQVLNLTCMPISPLWQKMFTNYYALTLVIPESDKIRHRESSFLDPRVKPEDDNWESCVSHKSYLKSTL